MDYMNLIKEKSYIKILIAGIINRFGDSIDAIAMTWLVYSVSQNASLTALNFGINFIPTVLIQPFAGAYVEKMNHKTILIFMDLLRGIVVFFIALLTYFQRIEGWMIIIATFLLSTAEAFRMPANNALTPLIVKKENFNEAIALQSSMFRLSELIGTGVAGIIIGLCGIHVAIAIDALSFFLSGFIILTVSIKPFLKIENKEKFFNDFKIGIKYLIHTKCLLRLCFIGMVVNALLVPINSLETVLCIEVYNKGAEFLSLMGIFSTIGNMLGAFVYPWLAKRYTQRQFMISFFVIMSLFYFSCILNKVFLNLVFLFYILLIISYFLLGAGAAVLSTYSSVNLLDKVDEGYLARISAVCVSLSTAAIPFCSFLVSFLSTFINVSDVFIVIAILSLLLALLYSIISKKRWLE